MTNILSVARRELRAFFQSPIAILFLGAFLFFTVLTFFWVEQFFTRNIADIRPLFSWLPLLLIFLCSALTMRLWSEEQKLGTIELLLTFPVKIHELVIGKFLASMALVAIALLLTIGVPLTVSQIGDLDWGPVIGGYAGAILLAGAYLAIGLFVSSLTENQIIALIISTLICGVFYVVGSEQVTQYTPTNVAETLHAIGTGSRFESIRRGVLDVRDIVYYLSIIVSFLTLNTFVLIARGWSSGPRTRRLHHAARITAALLIANAVVLNFVLVDTSSLRLDITERGEYSISHVTKSLLRNLPEPVLIRGYFSKKTHPLLAPTVPRIRDMIEEYGVLSNGMVRTEYVDPREDVNIEKEANQLYGVKSFPFQVADARDRAVVNSYFSILIKYGDQYEVLNFSDLIEIQGTNPGNVEVKLRNLEYDLTSTIKKVTSGFETLEAVFAKMETPAVFTAFMSTDNLPENFKEVPTKLTKVLEEIQKESNGQFKFAIVDPKKSQEWTPQRLEYEFGFQPFLTQAAPDKPFYLHWLMKVGGRFENVFPNESLQEADIKEELIAALKRLTPGFLKTVGIETAIEPQPPTPTAHGMAPPPQRDQAQLLREQLGETYQIVDANLKMGRVQGDVDVLLVMGPKDFAETKAFAIDQHLMKGGTVVVMTGKYDLDLQSRTGLAVNKIDSGLEKILESYGVKIEDSLVLDKTNDAIAIPVERDLGGFKVRDIVSIRYPFFADIRSSQMDPDSPVVGGIGSVVVPWASPVRISTPEIEEGKEPLKRKVSVLMNSSANSWVSQSTNILPDLERYPDIGFEEGKEQKSFPLAVMITGQFESAYKTSGPPSGMKTNVVKQSPESARLVVIGSSMFASDVLPQLSRQSTANFQLVQNLVDWGIQDTDLLTIRSRGTFDRKLLPLSSEIRANYQLLNIAVVIIALLIIIALNELRKRSLKPIPLDQSVRENSQQSSMKNASEAKA